MKDKNNNIIALLLIGGLFFWSLQMQKGKAEEKAKQATEQIEEKTENKKESLKSSPQKLGSTPSLVSAPVVKDSITDSTLVDSLVAPQVQPRTIVVENDLFTVTFDNKGAVVKSIVLKSLQDEEGEFPQLLLNEEKALLQFSLDKVEFQERMFAVDSSIADTIQVESEFQLPFVWEEDGIKLTRTFTFQKDSPKIKQSLQVQNYQANEYSIDFKAGLKETEKPSKGGFGLANYNFSEVFVKEGEEVSREMITEKTSFGRENNLIFAGVRRKYFATLIDFGKETDTRVIADKIDSKVEGHQPTYAFSMTGDFQGSTLDFDFVILPLKYNDVKALGNGYEKIIWDGWSFLWANKWFTALCGLILKLLNLIYGWVGNYGVAIIILTILVKTLTLPLMISQTRSMKKMAIHKPAMDEIRKKYSGDPQRYQQELMAYYKKEGINPMAQMAGCLPMFIQMPVFFSLFIVFSRTMELRGAPFFGWITDLAAPDIVTTAVTLPIVMPEGICLLPFIMAASTYFQTKQTMTDPNMKAMVYMMPVMMFTFSGVMPSGLVLYWIVSNIYSIIQYKVVGSPATNLKK